MTSVTFAPDAPEQEEERSIPQERPRKAAIAPRAVPPPAARVPAPPVAAPTNAAPPPALIALPRKGLSGFDIARIAPAARPAAPDAGPVGPAFTPARGDSEVVGTGSRGEKIYRARWYREPTPQEMRGYLSTADGPGWALINCRTEPGWRVDDCELVDEWPQGSGMGRAVLASAWQFQVRPPQVGGRVMVGEWVRIRISYELRQGN